MPEFRNQNKKFALTYSAPQNELHPWPDKELAFMAVDYHFSLKGRTVEKFLVAEEHHEDGRLHYHMYIEIDRRIDTTDPRYFDIDGLHPNIGKKPGKQEWLNYITKDGNYITNFFKPKISAYKRAIDVGGQEALEIIKNAHPRDWILNHQKFKAYFLKPYVGVRKVIWLWGPAGRGKTRYAVERYGAKICKWTSSGFLIGYQGESAVVINEIDKIKMPLHEFLDITDRYDPPLNIKGGEFPWCADTIIFTSTVPPDGVFVHEDAWQVGRRITEVIDITTVDFN